MRDARMEIVQYGPPMPGSTCLCDNITEWSSRYTLRFLLALLFDLTCMFEAGVVNYVSSPTSSMSMAKRRDDK